MRATYQLTTPDDVRASLALTGSVREFRDLLKTIRSVNTGHSYALSNLSYAIRDTVEAASKQFYAEVKDEPETPTTP